MDNGIKLKSLALGFLAGVIATVTVHELIKLVLFDAGVFPKEPWPMTPAAVTGLPQIVSSALWGGVWGSVFAVILGNVPEGSLTLRGALLGILGPALIGVFLLVPILKNEPVFLGGDPALIGSVVLILAGFGAATGWLYGFFTAGCRLPE